MDDAPKLNPANLLEGAMFVRNIPDEEWDFDYYVRNHTEEETVCDSVGCALGNMAIAGVGGMPKAALEVKKHADGRVWFVEAYDPVQFVKGQKITYHFDKQGREAFGMTYLESQLCFQPYSDRADQGYLPSNATQEQVASRMERLAQGREGFEAWCREQVAR